MTNEMNEVNDMREFSALSSFASFHTLLLLAGTVNSHDKFMHACVIFVPA